MIKILPIEDEKTDPRFMLEVTIGYGEHCDDTTTVNSMVIDDVMAGKWKQWGESDDDDDFDTFFSIHDAVTQEDAEFIVRLFEMIFSRKDKDGYDVDHIILNDGPSEFWWKEYGAMSDGEMKWLEHFMDQHSTLFVSHIDHNWYGIRDVQIVYIDGQNRRHRCEVVTDNKKRRGNKDV